MNQTDSPSEIYDQFAYYDVNRVWLSLDEREPASDLSQAVQEIDGFERAMYAYNRYQEIQREPLANSLTGMLFAGFWVALLLGLIDFAFYMAITIRRRAVSFATLQAIGWNERDLLRLLFVEQAAFITPALIIGVLLGLGLAYLILPFLALIGGQTLQLPLTGILTLLLVFIIAFALILRLTAAILHRFSLNQVMRFGE